MHDATTTQPRAADNTLQPRTEGLCVGYGETTGRDTPLRVERTSGNAQVGDVIQVLKTKRDRYKGRNKLIQAATVQACIDELRGVWK